MTADQRIHEAMDACRRGCGDLKRPEFADLSRLLKSDPQLARRYAQVQRFDARIQAALEDVPIPPGLESRILERLTAAQRGNRAAGPWRTRPAATRRSVKLLWFGAATAAALLVAAGTALRWSGNEPLTGDHVWALAEGWCQQVDPQHWRSMDSAPAGFPPSPRLLARRLGWQPVRGGQPGGGVAYNLSGNGGPAALLLVARTRVAGLPSRPPRRPLWTQNRSVAAWQAGPLLFVLVVDGPPERYRRYVDSRTPPLA